jgi:hypothetical protein
MAEATAASLTERDRAVLAFERQWWKYAGAKEEAIRRQFGVSPTAYYQLLSRLIDDPLALAADPMLVKRLQRQRAARRRQRAARTPRLGAGEVATPGEPSAAEPTAGSGEALRAPPADRAGGVAPAGG